jgi:hypothetical protein
MEGGAVKCRGRTAEGKPCNAPEELVDESTGFCIGHGPEGSKRTAMAGKLGAAATRAKWRGKGLEEGELGPLKTPEDAERWLRIAGEAVAVGRLTDRSGTAITRAVEAWLKASAVRVEREEIADLRVRIDELRKPKAI